MTAIKHALQRDIFTPNDERLLCIVNVCKAGKKKKNCFLCATGRQACSRLQQRLRSIKQYCVCEILLPPPYLSHHRETCPGESGESEEVWQGGFLQTAADMGAQRSDRSGCQRCQQGQKTVWTFSHLTLGSRVLLQCESRAGCSSSPLLNIFFCCTVFFPWFENKYPLCQVSTDVGTVFRCGLHLKSRWWQTVLKKRQWMNTGHHILNSV